jgi:hypothetical protein
MLSGGDKFVVGGLASARASVALPSTVLATSKAVARASTALWSAGLAAVARPATALWSAFLASVWAPMALSSAQSTLRARLYARLLRQISPADSLRFTHAR